MLSRVSGLRGLCVSLLVAVYELAANQVLCSMSSSVRITELNSYTYTIELIGANGIRTTISAEFDEVTHHAKL